MNDIVAILALFVFVAAFGALMVWVSGLFGPKSKQSKMKTDAYECGLEVQETGNTSISVKFYLTAILFILFDIEIIFMYPWALTFSDFVDAGSGIYILSAMGLFLAVFIFGLVWEIKSRALEWE